MMTVMKVSETLMNRFFKKVGVGKPFGMARQRKKGQGRIFKWNGQKNRSHLNLWVDGLFGTRSRSTKEVVLL